MVFVANNFAKAYKKKLEALNREIAIGLEQAKRGESVEFDFDELMQEVDEELGYTNTKP
jgi:phospholipase/lecithinase/hemolysin